MQYITVFDVARDGFTAWWATAFGAGFVALGTAVLVYLRRQVGPKARLRKMLMVVWTGFAVVWTFAAYSGTHAGYVRLRNALMALGLPRFNGRVSDKNYAAASNCSSYSAGLT